MNDNEHPKSIAEVFRDRSLIVFLVALALVDLICSIIIFTHIEQSDIMVYSRYTAFGQVHFYKGHWQYLLSLVAFLSVVAGVHGALMVKFSTLGKKSTAKFLGWLALLVMIIATVYSIGVLSLGRAG